MTTPKKTFKVQTAHDHFESIMLCSPLAAIEELIWNALDADALNISVEFQRNEMNGIDRIVVKDDGLGIPKNDYENAFGSLGGSPKRSLKSTPSGRDIHGKSGQGRIRAFRLGRKVTWRIKSKGNNGTLDQYDLVSFAHKLDSVNVENEKASTVGMSGTEVIIETINENHSSLASEPTIKTLCRHLSVYLLKYQNPRISIVYDGVKIDPITEIQRQKKITVHIPYDGNLFKSELVVIEWKDKVERKIHLCDAAGFTLEEVQPGLHSSGIHYTAHLKSEALPLMLKDNVLLTELDPSGNEVIKTVKNKLRSYFKIRKEEKHREIIEGWQRDKIYPYDPKTSDPVTRVQRDVFDICALTIHKHLPSFKKSQIVDKQFQFQLLKVALEDNPDSVGKIMRDVLSLNKDEQDSFASLLEKTKLSSVIRTTSLVVDRMKFIESLNILLFTDFKQQLLETQQLHKMLLDNLWIFGEQYQIKNSDQRLTTLLEEHIRILERDLLVPSIPSSLDLATEDLEKLRIDLMLYTRIPSPTMCEHLVVELKRPAVKIGEKEVEQIKKYARKIAADPRFDKNKVRWTFLLLGNELNDYAQAEANQSDRRPGVLYHRDNLTAHVKTWASIIEEAKWRYDIYYKYLVTEASKEDMLDHLQKNYSHLLPQPKEKKGARGKKKTAKKRKVSSALPKPK